MVYAKYIKRNGKYFGPYYYKSVRDENGRVRNIYVGREVPSGEKMNGPVTNNTMPIDELKHQKPGPGSRKPSRTPYILAVTLLAVAMGSAFVLQPGPSGNIIGIASTQYSPGDFLSGSVSLEFGPGDIIPRDTDVVVTLGNHSSSMPMEEFVSSSANPIPSAVGIYSRSGTLLGGSGEGYGVQLTKHGTELSVTYAYSLEYAEESAETIIIEQNNTVEASNESLNATQNSTGAKNITIHNISISYSIANGTNTADVSMGHPHLFSPQYGNITRFNATILMVSYDNNTLPNETVDWEWMNGTLIITTDYLPAGQTNATDARELVANVGLEEFGITVPSEPGSYNLSIEFIYNQSVIESDSEQVFVSAPLFDSDNDGFSVIEDCDDLNGSINPNAKEKCYDGLDNNCDGRTDEGCPEFVCSNGSVKSCGNSTGECWEGMRVCQNNSWGPCEGRIGPSPEVCDGLDNDCDGIPDDDCVEPPCQDGQTRFCGNSTGECWEGVQACLNGSWGDCEGMVMPSPELCDGLDNDCDGIPDDDCIELNVTQPGNVTEPQNATQTENETESPMNATNQTIPENITQPGNITAPNATPNETIGNVTIPNETIMNESLPNVTIPNATNATIPNATNTSAQNLTDANITEESTVQYGAVLGKPVRWVKKVKLSKSASNVKVKLPENIINVSVKKLGKQANTTVSREKIKIHSPEPITGQFTVREEADDIAAMISSIVSDFLDWLSSSITGNSLTGNIAAPPGVPANVVINKSLKETEIIIEDEVEEVEIEYYTDAPQSYESRLGGNVKQVVISSAVHYENVLAFTELPMEARTSDIRLDWIVDGVREGAEFEAFDTNNNGLADYIEWVVPHTSNQTYEITITILNVHSYPTIFHNWTVRFNTTGKADLRIRPVSGTTWSQSDGDGTDLQFLDLRCGEQSLAYEWDNGGVLVRDYECPTTGYETSKELSYGSHYLEFEFGNETATAENFVAGSTLNVTFDHGNYTEDTVWNGTGRGGLEAGPDYRRSEHYNNDSSGNLNATGYGLIGYYRFDYDSGTTDLSPMGNDLTFNGDVNVENSTLNVWDGDYASFQHDFGTGNWSVAFWYKTNESDRWQGIIGRGSPYTGSGYGWQFRLENDNDMVFTMRNSTSDGATARYADLHTKPNFDEWHFVVGTVDRTNSNVSIYYDGDLKNSAALPNGDFDNPSYPDINIGAYALITNYWSLNGSIDEVAFFNRTLQPREIYSMFLSRSRSANYTSMNFTPERVVDWAVFNASTDVPYGNDYNDPDLWLYIDFDDDVNNHAVDKSPYQKNGLPYGDATISEDNCLEGHGKCLYMDGADDWVNITDNLYSLDGQTGISVCAWVYLTTIGTTSDAQDSCILCHKNLLLWYNVNQDGSGDHVYSFNAGATVDPNNRASTPVDSVLAKKWQHVCGVMDGANRYIYMDGVLMGSGGSGDAVLSDYPGWANIGFWEYSSNLDADAYVDDVLVVNRSLSADEIYAIYKDGVSRVEYQTCILNGTMCRGPDITPNETWQDNLTAMSPVDGSNNVAGYWRFNGNTSLDISTQNNEGDFLDNAHAESGMLELDGDGDAFNTTTEFDGNKAVSLWAKSAVDGDTQVVIFGCNSPDSANDRWYFGYDGSGGELGIGIGNSDWADEGGIILDDEWHHYVLSSNGTNHSIYVDGEWKGSKSGVALGSGTGDYYIGALNSNGGVASGYEFNGLIDDVILFNRSISVDEVKELYNRGGDAKLIAHFDKDVKDSSMYSNDGAMNGNPLVSQDMITFDGNDNVNFSQDSEFDVTANFSFAFWGKILSTKLGYFVAKRDNAEGTYSIYFDGTHLDFIRDTSLVPTSYSPDMNIWKHYTFTFDDTNVYMYLDGVLFNIFSQGGAIPSEPSVPLTLGSRLNSGAIIFGINASMDEFVFYGRNLTATEVSKLYNAKHKSIPFNVTNPNSDSIQYKAFFSNNDGNYSAVIHDANISYSTFGPEPPATPPSRLDLFGDGHNCSTLLADAQFYGVGSECTASGLFDTCVNITVPINITKAASLVLENCKLYFHSGSSLEQKLYIYGNLTALVTNITGSTNSYELTYYAGNAVIQDSFVEHAKITESKPITFLNTTRVNVSVSGSLKFQGYVELNVTDNANRTGIAEGNVSLYNTTGDLAYRTTTVDDYIEAIGNDGILAYWNFEENGTGGLTLNDKAAPGYLTKVAQVYLSFNHFGQAKDESGNRTDFDIYDDTRIENNYMTLDGNADYIKRVDAWKVSNDSTLSMWIKEPRKGMANNLLTDFGPYYFQFSATDRAYHYTYNGSGNINSATAYTDVLPRPNNWREYTVRTHSYHNMTWFKTIYLDGISHRNTTHKYHAPQYDNTYVDFAIGGSGGAGWFNGSVDEFIFWNKSLTDEEIANLYLDGTGQGDIDCNFKGYVGTGCKMDGAGDGITIENSSIYGFDNAKPFSWAFWIKPEAPSGDPIIAKSWVGDLGYVIKLDPDGHVRFLDNPTSTTYAQSSTIANGSWSHYVIVYNTTHLLFYLNGKLDGTQPATLSDDFGSNMTIGFGYNAISSSYRYFNGIIDEVAIWNRSLSASDAKKLFRMGWVKLNVTEYIENAGTNDWWTNYTLNVSKPGYTTNITRFNMSNVDLDIILNGFGEQQAGTTCGKCLVVKNSSGSNVSLWDKSGNIDLYGNLYTRNYDSTNGNDLEFKNSSGTTVAWIDNANGNMRITGDFFSGYGTSCSSDFSSFTIRNSTGDCVAYINQTGDLWISGSLTEGANI